MTSQPAGKDDNKARAFFATALTVCAGFAGLAVAGLVLGLDYLLHGEPDEQDRLSRQRAQRHRDRYADALAWLENDRQERERFRQRRREWFVDDPETRGDAPASGETAGRVLGRAWNNLLVGLRRFKNGWKTGRDTARERRAAGDENWWRGRADRTSSPTPTDDTHDGSDRPTDGSPDPDPAGPEAQAPDPADEIIDAEIVPDPEPATREVVPVGQDEPQRPDETVGEYQRRLEALENEIQQNRNGHRPDPALN